MKKAVEEESAASSRLAVDFPLCGVRQPRPDPPFSHLGRGPVQPSPRAAARPAVFSWTGDGLREPFSHLAMIRCPRSSAGSGSAFGIFLHSIYRLENNCSAFRVLAVAHAWSCSSPPSPTPRRGRPPRAGLWWGAMLSTLERSPGRGVWLGSLCFSGSTKFCRQS